MVNNNDIIILLSLLFILINIGSINYVESISYGGIYMCCTCCYLLVWRYCHHYYNNNDDDIYDIYDDNNNINR